MKKLLLLSCAAALMLGTLSGAALAQRGPGVRRMPGLGGQKKQIDPQLGGARDRLPGKPPLLGTIGAPANPNRAKQLQIQRQRLMETLGLSSDQRLKMGEIKRNHEDEAIALGRRIRQARNGLDRAIMRPDYDEALVRRYTEELAAAQADQIRFQSRMRAQMRSVLTSEQVMRLLQLEQERRRQIREERRDLNKEDGDQAPEASKTKPPAPEEERDLFTFLIFPS